MGVNGKDNYVALSCSIHIALCRCHYTCIVFILISAHAPISAHSGRLRKHVHKRTLLD